MEGTIKILKQADEIIYPKTVVLGVVNENNRSVDLLIDDALETAKDYTDVEEQRATLRENAIQEDLDAEKLRSHGIDELHDTRISSLEALIDADQSGYIDKFNEIVDFLENIDDEETLSGIVAGINQSITDEQNARVAVNNTHNALIAALFANAKATISISPSIIYRNLNTEVTVTGKFTADVSSMIPSSITITGEGINNTAENTKTVSDTTFLTTTLQSTQYSVSATYKGCELAGKATLNSYWPIYYGFSTQNSTVDIVKNIISNGTKDPASSDAKHTYSATCNANNSGFYLIIPFEFSISSFSMGGAPVSSTVTTVYISDDFQTNTETASVETSKPLEGNYVKYQFYKLGSTYNNGVKLTIKAE